MKSRRFLILAAFILLCVGAALMLGVGRQIPPAWQLRRYDLYADNMRRSGHHYETEVKDRDIKARLASLLASAEPTGEEHEPIEIDHDRLHDVFFRLVGEKDEYAVYLEGTQEKLDIYSAGRYAPTICIEKKKGSGGWTRMFEMTAADYADLIDIMFVPVFGGE